MYNVNKRVFSDFKKGRGQKTNSLSLGGGVFSTFIYQVRSRVSLSLIKVEQRNDGQMVEIITPGPSRMTPCLSADWHRTGAAHTQDTRAHKRTDTHTRTHAKIDTKHNRDGEGEKEHEWKPFPGVLPERPSPALPKATSISHSRSLVIPHRVSSTRKKWDPPKPNAPGECKACMLQPPDVGNTTKGHHIHSWRNVAVSL